MINEDSWVEIAPDSDFSIHNLPFGIFSTPSKTPRAGVAIGDKIIDLLAASELGVFNALSIAASVFDGDVLNDFISLGKEKTSALRLLVQKELVSYPSLLNHEKVLVDQAEATMHLPVRVGDYTDFYSSMEHATNVGKMFRDPENALLPNWKHIPVGYHGRASSIIVSGSDIHRPMGQVLPPEAKTPIYSASKRVDFELEMAFIVGKNTSLGDTVGVNEAEDYIFGKVLFNDWSARDVQKWEYVPLGPFLAKSFASSISPWIVTMDALEPFRVAGPEQHPEPLPYLRYEGDKNFDIDLQVAIVPEGSEETIVSNSNFKYMYWNMAQQLAHHTMNGCNLGVGDMMGSGTISGKSEDSYGSMLELAWAGQKPLIMKDGSERRFIEDNDTVIMRGHGEKNGLRVGFGELRTKLLPAKK